MCSADKKTSRTSPFLPGLEDLTSPRDGLDSAPSSCAKSTPSARKSSRQSSGLLHTPTTGDNRPAYEKRYPGGRVRPSPIPNLAAEIKEGVAYIDRRSSRQGSGLLKTPRTSDSNAPTRNLSRPGQLREQIDRLSSSPTSSPSMAPDSGEQLCLPGASPASLSVTPGSDEARRMTVTSGRKCCELYKRPGPLGSLARMLMVSGQWFSTRTHLEWTPDSILAKRWNRDVLKWVESRNTKGRVCWMRLWVNLKRVDTKSSRFSFLLSASMPRTAGCESGLLPTAMGMNREPTPEQTLERQRIYGGKTRAMYMQDRLNLIMLKTPSSVETEGGVMEIRPGCDGHYKLRDQIAMLRTPQAGDGDHSGPNARDSSGRPHLTSQIAMLPTPNQRDWKGECNQQSVPTKIVGRVGSKTGLKLQPAFVEWMMGYPPGFTHVESKDSRHSATPSSRKSPTKSSRESRK